MTTFIAFIVISMVIFGTIGLLSDDFLDFVGFGAFLGLILYLLLLLLVTLFSSGSYTASVELSQFSQVGESAYFLKVADGGEEDTVKSVNLPLTLKKKGNPTLVVKVSYIKDNAMTRMFGINVKKDPRDWKDSSYMEHGTYERLEINAKDLE